MQTIVRINSKDNYGLLQPGSLSFAFFLTIISISYDNTFLTKINAEIWESSKMLQQSLTEQETQAVR